MKDRKRLFNLISSITSLFVTAGLLIMVIFGWYATNKKATVEGGIGATAGPDLIVVSNTTYKMVDGEKYESDKLGGMLVGDSIYFEVQLRTTDLSNNLTISVSALNVEGGAFFKDGELVEGQTDTREYLKENNKLFNMCDVYCYRIVDVYVSSTEGYTFDNSTKITAATTNIASKYVTPTYFERADATSTSLTAVGSQDMLKYTGWDATTNNYIAFRFEFTLSTGKVVGKKSDNTDKTLGDILSINELSDRSIKIGNVMFTK